MVSFQTYQQLALSFPDTEQAPHFDKISFRVGKSIFATYWEKEHRAVLMLSVVDQSVFCSYDSTMFFPIPNKWGLKGATFVELSRARKTVFKEALAAAYNGLMAKKTFKKK